MPSRILHLTCRKCSTPVLDYRKSGSGRLVRLYIDHITGPAEWSRLKNPGRSFESSHSIRTDVSRMTSPGEWSSPTPVTRKAPLPRLVCATCGQLLGLPTQHDGRKAYRLVPGALGKQADG